MTIVTNLQTRHETYTVENATLPTLPTLPRFRVRRTWQPCQHCQPCPTQKVGNLGNLGNLDRVYVVFEQQRIITVMTELLQRLLNFLAVYRGLGLSTPPLDKYRADANLRSLSKWQWGYRLGF